MKFVIIIGFAILAACAQAADESAESQPDDAQSTELQSEENAESSETKQEESEESGSSEAKENNPESTEAEKSEDEVKPSEDNDRRKMREHKRGRNKGGRRRPRISGGLIPHNMMPMDTDELKPNLNRPFDFPRMPYRDHNWGNPGRDWMQWVPNPWEMVPPIPYVDIPGGGGIQPLDGGRPQDRLPQIRPQILPQPAPPPVAI